MCLLSKHHALLYYDYGKNSYEIADKKLEHGDRQALDPDDVEELSADFPGAHCPRSKARNRPIPKPPK